MQTYNVVMDGKCIGDTLYCTGNKLENPDDSEKVALEAVWTENKDCGPEKRITTTGNVIGTTLTEGVTDETLLAQYLIDYYDFPEKTTPAIDSDGNIHICDDDGNYIILNADGTEKYKRQLGSKIWSSPVIADYGIVYVTYEDNGACKLIAIDCGIEGPANSPWAQRGQNAKRNALQK